MSTKNSLENISENVTKSVKEKSLSCGLIREIAEFECDSAKAIKVRNGLSTQADEVFIGDSFCNAQFCCLPIYKASNGQKSYVIYPYDLEGITAVEPFFNKS